MRDMKLNVFLKKDNIEDMVIDYESPVIQIEEVIVEHGFTISNPGGDGGNGGGDSW